MKSWKTGALMVLSGMMLISCTESTTKDNEIQIISVEPNAAKVGETVTLNGYMFTKSMLACFGVDNCVSVDCDSPVQAKVEVPYGSGTVDVIVEDNGHTSVLKNGFTYLAGGIDEEEVKPVVTTVAPVSGFAGDEVTLTGSHLEGTTKVCFGLANCVTPKSATASTVVVEVPEGTGTAAVIIYVGDKMYTSGLVFDYLKSNNEQNSIDWCTIVSTSTNFEVTPDQDVTVYAQVYEEGCTPNAQNNCNSFKGEVGYISAEGALDDMSAYTWQTASRNGSFAGSSNNDEYMAKLKLPVGEYRFAYRFSRGGEWLYCDMDGSNNGFRGDNTGTLKVADRTVEWCRIISMDPKQPMKSNVNEDSPTVYAQFFVKDCTNKDNHCPDLKVDIGYGQPYLIEPYDLNKEYTWKPATLNTTPGNIPQNHDEYMGVLNTSVGDLYSVVFRGSMDGGKTWRYCSTADTKVFNIADAASWLVNDPEKPMETNKTIVWCNLKTPSSFKVEPNTSLPMIYGQVYIPDCTNKSEDCPNLVGQVGFGTPTQDITSFNFTDATRNKLANSGNNHEYEWNMPAGLTDGTYNYLYRFSTDNKVTWKYCDLTTGSNDPSEIDRKNLGNAVVGVTWCQLRNGDLGTINVGMKTPVFSHVYLKNCTGKETACNRLKAQVGYGKKTETDTSNFKWVDAEFYADSNTAAPGVNSLNSEYIGYLSPTEPGDYLVTYRYSTDNGQHWIYCDTDTSTNTYNKDMAGRLTVERSADVTWCQVRTANAGTINLGQTSQEIFAHVFVQNCTGKDKLCESLTAEICYGPKDDTNTNNFKCVPATYYPNSTTAGVNNSEYVGRVTPSSVGDFAIAYRFSVDNKQTWTYCDTNESTIVYDNNSATQIKVEESQGPTWCQVRNNTAMGKFTKPSSEVYCHVYVKNCTGKNTNCEGLTAEIGYGSPDETDPSKLNWSAANFFPNSTTASANNSEYVGTVTPPATGEYAVAYRFKYNTSDWVYCDTDEILGYDKEKATRLSYTDYWSKGSDFKCGIDKSFADSASAVVDKEFQGYGQIWIPGCTQNKNKCDKISSAHMHYTQTSGLALDEWTSVAATYNSNYSGDKNNEYLARTTFTKAGDYSYIYSFDLKIPDSDKTERHYCYYDWAGVPASLNVRETE